MSENTCPQCGAPIPAGATECKYCGESLAKPAGQPVQGQPMPQQQQYQQPQYQQPMYQQPPVYPQAPYPQAPYGTTTTTVYNVSMTPNNGVNPAWPIKSKVAAGLLAIFLGGIGIHKFYLGKAGMGILYLLFCWTGIPAIIGLIEGIIYLTANDHNFEISNHVRLQ